MSEACTRRNEALAIGEETTSDGVIVPRGQRVRLSEKPRCDLFFRVFSYFLS
jgi:hypothetical protein